MIFFIIDLWVTQKIVLSPPYDYKFVLVSFFLKNQVLLMLFWDYVIKCLEV